VKQRKFIARHLSAKAGISAMLEQGSKAWVNTDFSDHWFLKG
jgi:hypothetical protein